jgi:hypothetical protein
LAQGGDAGLFAIAIDPTDIYVTAQYNDASAGGLLRTSIDGGTMVTLANESSAAEFVAVDTTNVYWTTFDGVLAMPKDGGAPSTLASGPQDFEGVAADGTNVYWAAANTGTIVRYAVDGGFVATLATGQEGPVSLALDTESIYWINLGASAGATIVRVSKAGGTPSTLAANTPSMGGIAVEGDSVYWTLSPSSTGLLTSPSSVLAVSIDGGLVSTLATGLNVPPEPPAFMYLVADPASIYFTAVGLVGGGIYSAPVDGGAAMPLTPQVFALGIAASSETLYWIGDNVVWSRPKP